jgi:hypothetical protein
MDIDYDGRWGGAKSSAEVFPWPKAAAAPQKTICGEAGVNEQYKQMTHLPRLRRSSIRWISIAVGGGEVQKAPSSEIEEGSGSQINVLARMAGKRLLSEPPLERGRGNDR